MKASLKDQLQAVEVRYRQIVETAHEGIWIIDAENKTTFANERLAEMLGCTVEEMVGKSIFDFVDQSWHSTADENAVHSRHSAQEARDIRFVRKDGSVLWAIVKAAPILEEGQYSGSLGMLTDMTDRKLLEETLRNTVQKLHDTNESINEAFISLDNHFRITYFNRVAERRFEKRRKDVLGRNLFDVFPEFKKSIFEEKFTEAFQKKQHIAFATYFDVSPYKNWYDVRITPQEDGLAIFFQVTTGRIRIEETLQKSEERYQLLFNRMLDAFAVHEIICDEGDKPVDYRFLQVNPAFEKQTGLRAADIIGKTVLEVLPGTEKYWIETYGKVALSGEPLQFEKFSQELGKYYQVVAFSPQKRQFATIFEDITKRKLAEEELHKAKEELDLRVKERTIELIEINQRLKNEIEERKLAEQVVELEREKLKRILDIMPGGVYIINRNCDIEYVNPYMEKEFGVVSGQKCYQYFHDRSESCPWCINERVWGGDSLKWDWHFAKVNKTYELFDTPLHNADGTISKLEIFYDITARKEAEDKVRQRNRELTAINEIGRAITSTMDLHTLLAELLNHVKGVIEAQLCTVGLIDSETEDILFYQLGNNTTGVELTWEQRFKKGEGVSGWVIEHKQSVLLDEVSQDPRPKVEYYQQQDFHPRSMASIPLIAQDVVIGTIGIFHEQPKWFDMEDVRLVEAVASQAAVVIQNAKLFEAEQQARKTAEILRSTALALSKSLNIYTVLETLLDQIRKVVPYESAHAYLMDDLDTAVVRVAHGEEQWDEDNRLLNQRIDIGSLPTLQPLLAGEVISISNIIDQAELAILANPKYIKSWLGIPLLSEGQVIGICTLEHSRPAFFTDDLIHWAKTLTDQAAVAIQNAWLFEQVREGRERLQALSRRLVEVQESERKYISRELHDEAGQTLASLMVGLHLLEREADDQPAIIQHCKDLKQIANAVMEDIHRLAIDLRPASLDRVGLVAALQQHSERISDLHDLAIQFHSAGNVQRLQNEVETAIYRIVQEALTNIVRHAKASRADVLLDWRLSSLVVIVEDNGVGFDPVTPDANHLGMVGMRERADMLGGNIIIESSHGKGSSIFLEVPYVYSHIDR